MASNIGAVGRRWMLLVLLDIVGGHWVSSGAVFCRQMSLDAVGRHWGSYWFWSMELGLEVVAVTDEPRGDFLCTSSKADNGHPVASGTGGHWRSMDVNGCRWMLLDVIGCHWMLLHAVGCRWVSLDVIGCCWMSLDVVGCCWMSLDVGCHWMLLDVVGRCWMLLDVLFGCC